jgi:hypothetical protein
MTVEDDDRTSDERRVGAIIAAYLEALDRGETADRGAVLQQHPDCARELESFFADQDRVRGLVPAGPPTAAAAGHRLGDYELLEEIGRGGMGVVFRARQISLGRLVAVKVILAADIASAEELWRFRREAETVAGLEHPHIIPIYEAGVHQGHPYFSMPLMEGGSLAGGPTRDPRTAAEMVAAVAGAVHYAHERGVLHRDLKPANILLDAEGRPHVADFGLARRADDTAATPSGAVLGTPAYVAPEQARGEKNVTVAVDVYGLGAILYELLTGRPPFQAATPLDTLLQVLEKEPDPPRRLKQGIDRDLEAVCLKCLEKDAARRYPSAQALGDDLGRWLRGEAVQARRARPGQRLARRLRRRPLIAAFSLLAALASAAALFWVGWAVRNLWSREAERPAEVPVQASTEPDYFKTITDLAAMGPNLKGNPRARELLEACPPESRGLEWYCLKGLWRGPKVVPEPPGLFDEKAPPPRLAGAGRSAPLTPHWANGEVTLTGADGRRTITWGDEGSLRIHDTASGWYVTLPVVEISYPTQRKFLPAAGDFRRAGFYQVFDRATMHRCVQLIEGESLAWRGERPRDPPPARRDTGREGPKPGPPAAGDWPPYVVYVCNLRPGAD